jgi:hypothetical protein
MLKRAVENRTRQPWLPPQQEKTAAFVDILHLM